MQFTFNYVEVEYEACCVIITVSLMPHITFVYRNKVCNNSYHKADDDNHVEERRL